MNSLAAEWRPGPSVCRCCLTEGCYKDISTEYFWMGRREVYAEMLAETFDLTIAYSKSPGPNSNSRLICEACIARLRDASSFKLQVRDCERTFHQHLDPASSAVTLDGVLDVPAEPVDKSVKLEAGRAVKVERLASDDDDDDDAIDDVPDFGDDDDDDDDLDDQPLTRLASKTPKRESVDLTDLLDNAKAAVKRKSSATKTKASPAKKAKQSSKKVKASATAAAKPPKPAKKKKEIDWLVVARHNAKVVLKYSTACPFRMPGNGMTCVYCCDDHQDPAEYRAHMRADHKLYNVDTAFAHTTSNYNEFLKVDCTELACRICETPFDTIEDISRHLREAHGKKVNTNIETGMQMFKLGPEKYVCALCPTKLPSLRELSRHTSGHYHKYTCEHCGKSYINRENLQRHIQFGHSMFKICLKCKTSFPNNAARREHVLATEKCWPQSCGMCGQRFVNRKLKLDHMASVHGQAPKTYTCPDCGEVYNKWGPYRAHFILSHTNDIFSCSFCGIKFDTKRNLTEHLVIHTKEKSFVCNVCSKTFSRKKNLIQHSWVHNEIKRFECTPCNKQFNQRVSWKTHMKSYHPELVDF